MTQDLEQKVSERIKETIGDQNLNRVLWRQGFQGQQGPTSVDYEVECGRVSTEAAQYLAEMEDTFHSEYYKWQGDLHNHYMNGEDEDFNEETEGYTEDEMYDAVDEWVDGDGWVFQAYQAFVATIITEVMEEIKYEEFEKECEEYKQKLQTIDGLQIYNSTTTDENGISYVDGLHVFDYDEETNADDFIELWITYDGDSTSGWEYGGFDTFDELFDYLKNNVKNIKKVA